MNQKAAADQPQPTDSADASAELVARIEVGDARVAVIGLGYVGLPLLREFCLAGYAVTGYDIVADRVASILAGRSYVRSVESADLARFVEEKRLTATTDPARLAECDAIVICVPTPLDDHRDPDMSFVRATAEAIAAHLRPGQLVVLESTTYPGTTEEVLRPILEAGGLRAGRDFFLAYSPEREDPGNARWKTRDIPKVVGADDPASAAAARALYRRAVVDVVPVSSARAAEATKILENIYRCVNIALVNELKLLFDRMDIDVWEVIGAAATKPFGFQAFWPGPGLGGHCIPVDPFYLSWKAREYGMRTRFIELAGEVNTGMPAHVATRVQDALNRHGLAVKGSRLLIVGVAYKRDVDDVRESPALELIALLRDRGAEVGYHDPFVPRLGAGRHWRIELDGLPLDDATLAAQDAVVIVTDHSGIDWERLVARSKLVIDTRNATAAVRDHRDRIVKA